MSNDEIRELYEKETGRAFVRTPLEPMQPVPMKTTFKAMILCLLPLLIMFGVLVFLK